jgi:hypothetical protein
MNKIILLCLVLGLSIASQAQKIPTAKKGRTYGKKITSKGAITITELAKKLANTAEFNGKITAVVTSVCEKKGCWMKLKNTEGDDIMVRFKDYEFFMPLNIVGKTIVAQGLAKTETTTVEELKHYAEDAGKSKEEIEKITEAKTEITFTAVGVVVIN